MCYCYQMTSEFTVLCLRCSGWLWPCHVIHPFLTLCSVPSVKYKLYLIPQNVRRHAKNVIVFIGDGMGMSTITAARIYRGQLRGKSGEENQLSFEQFPTVGLSKTYNVNKQVTYLHELKCNERLNVLPALSFTIPRSAHTAVFIYFVWIWKQTAIISLYNINWLVCITETECVYCEVRTGSSSLMQVNLGFKELNVSFCSLLCCLATQCQHACSVQLDTIWHTFSQFSCTLAHHRLLSDASFSASTCSPISIRQTAVSFSASTCSPISIRQTAVSFFSPVGLLGSFAARHECCGTVC